MKNICTFLLSFLCFNAMQGAAKFQNQAKKEQQLVELSKTFAALARHRKIEDMEKTKQKIATLETELYISLDDKSAQAFKLTRLIRSPKTTSFNPANQKKQSLLNAVSTAYTAEILFKLASSKQVIITEITPKPSFPHSETDELIVDDESVVVVSLE